VKCYNSTCDYNYNRDRICSNEEITSKRHQCFDVQKYRDCCICSFNEYNKCEDCMKTWK
jgi:hypothetical protein